MDIYEFVAWALDFEGCISIGKHVGKTGRAHYGPAIRLNNTSLKLLYAFRDRIKFGTVNSNTNISAQFNDIYVWSLSALEIREHLPKIFPYLVLKGNPARIVLEFLALVGSQSWEPRSYELNSELDNLYRQCRVWNEKRPTERSPEEEMLRLLRRR